MIQIDFSIEGRIVETYTEKIYEEIKTLDIGIVVNNAGVNTRGFFRDLSAEEVHEMAVVNTYPYTLMTKVCLPLLQSRGQHYLVRACSV
jgi:17beta-estradiol 17-dehydrogenase / very-long-chain 3-oxoacyl-CoA reductase